MELSGWQTVAISIGGSTVTALAILLGSGLQGRQEEARLQRRLSHELDHQRRELEAEWRKEWAERLVRVADAFTEAMASATLALRDASDALNDAALEQWLAEEDGKWEYSSVRQDPTVRKALEHLRQEVDRARTELVRVHLLFGDSSETGRAGTEVLKALREGMIEITERYPGPDEKVVKAARDAATKASVNFARRALEQIRDPDSPARTQETP